jgi:hypothetical protein
MASARPLHLFALILTFPVVCVAEAVPGPIAARVADEPIYLAELTEGASSLALVGYEDIRDRPGTRERLLERLITARVLYLDGNDRHLDQSPRYRADLGAMSDAILAARQLEALRQRECAAAGGGHRCAITTAELRERELSRLHASAKVTIDEASLDPAHDAGRDELAPVARIGEEEISWRRFLSEVRTTGATARERVAQVERVVASHLLAHAGRDAGLDRDPGFQEMVQGWRRGEIVKLVREEVAERTGLDETGVVREYEQHRANFTLSEQRKVQEIVVRTREEAEEIRRILASPPPGTTFYTVARDRSIAPEAKQTLGVIGWMSGTQGEPVLRAAAFALASGAISSPIETSTGFHVIRVLEQRPEEVLPLDDHLRERIRARWDANRIAEYAERLAQTKFKVTLYPEVYRLPDSQTATAQP